MKRVLSLSTAILTAGIVVGAASSAMATDPARLAAAPYAEAERSVAFNVYLPLRNVDNLKTLLANQQIKGSGSYHKWLTPDQFNTRFGPTAASKARVIGALQNHGFTIVSSEGRVVKVSGTAKMVNAAFATRLKKLTGVHGNAPLASETPLKFEATLASEGVHIHAFDGIPAMHTHVHRSADFVKPNNGTSVSGGYNYNDMKQAYGYPSYQVYDGTGVSIAVVISATPADSDVALMFTNQNFTATTGKAAPTLTHVTIDGGPTAASQSGAIDEADLDVQQMIGGAPGAKVSVFEIPDLYDDHIQDGYNYAVNAGGAAYQAINSSFGECELFYTAAYNGGTDMTSGLADYDAIFMQGNAEGITFVASSGDEGGLGCPEPGYLGVKYGGSAPTGPQRWIPGTETPSASPYVTAVGGGNLLTNYTSGSLDSSYLAENANGDPEVAYDPYNFGTKISGGYWGAGGGLSSYYSNPSSTAYSYSYQNSSYTGSTARTVPDVGMQVGGCPGGESILPCGPNRSYVITYIGGSPSGLIGTSVASPEFVGALALYIQKSGGGVGNLNPYLYTKGAAQSAGGPAVFNRNIPGFDGRYTNSFPTTGYDYLVGNGTPQVAKLFGLGTVLAGVPQTASNP